MSYQVTCPLVLAHDTEGRVHERYQDAIIGWLSDVQAEHFLSLGLVVRVGDPGSAVVDGAGDPGAVSKVAKPAKTATDEKWVEFGVAQGHNRDELLALSKADLVELLG